VLHEDGERTGTAAGYDLALGRPFGMKGRALVSLISESEALHMVLCWLATADCSGRPRVSPKEIYRIAGERELHIADIASSGSVKNIRSNPAVSVALLDVFRQRGFKLHGRAEVVPSDASGFPDLAEPLLRKAEPKFKVRNLIVVSVERPERLLAPSYQFYPDTKTEAMIEDARRSYRVDELLPPGVTALER